jgi:hypothetical protein
MNEPVDDWAKLNFYLAIKLTCSLPRRMARLIEFLRSGVYNL